MPAVVKILITERVSPVPPDESFYDTDILLPNLITATFNSLIPLLVYLKNIDSFYGRLII